MIHLWLPIGLIGIIIIILSMQSGLTLEESPQIAFNAMNDTLYASILIDTQMEKTLAHLGQVRHVVEWPLHSMAGTCANALFGPSNLRWLQ